MEPIQEYQSRCTQYSSQLDSIGVQIKRVSNIRLFVFVLFTVVSILLFKEHYYLWFYVTIGLGAILFVIAVMWHNELYKLKDRFQKLYSINNQGIMRINNEWSSFADKGDEFVNHDHPFSWDLDITGKFSLFQMINTCRTWYGRQALAINLQNKGDSVTDIKEMQDAVKELSMLLDWRQSLELTALTTETSKNPETILSWCEKELSFFKHSFIETILYYFPYFTILASIVAVIVSGSFMIPFVLLLCQFSIFAIFFTSTNAINKNFESNGEILLTIAKLIEIIEQQKFKATCLNSIIDNQLTVNGEKSSEILRKFAKIIRATEIRGNPLVYVLANTFWLWDIKCVIKALKWKKKYGLSIRSWFTAIGKYEMLSSISVLAFENRTWVFPELTGGNLLVTGTDIGHPLLDKNERISNSFSIEKNQVAIITGSNMSGKSTFLRSVILNMILAYCGAPVCASKFKTSLLNIYTSMRINDDMSSKTSTFYAELLRIKKIIEAVKRNENVLFCLDELFRGTNSQDRHAGVLAVLAYLKSEKTIGLISTHDMELCSLGNTGNGYTNYHFEEHYESNAIQFDYKLKPGPSTTRNALFLIKMIGIDI
jgi:hypothetical protein